MWLYFLLRSLTVPFFSFQKTDQTAVTPKGAELASDTSSAAAKAKSSKGGMKNKGAQSQAPGQKLKKKSSRMLLNINIFHNYKQRMCRDLWNYLIYK